MWMGLVTVALRRHPSPELSSYFQICDVPAESMSDSMRTCYKFLNQTSRSFAAVIEALDGDLRHAVCIFYLVLRALDTVEDDMTIPLDKKVPMLNDFHTYLYQPDWRFTESHEKDRQISLEFRKLGQQYRDVISDICHRMGVGMAEFLEKKVGSMKEWDLLEPPGSGQDTEELANSMGLFLQKTNIIRDYLDDMQQGRAFWPQEAWSQFADRLEDLAQPEKLESALACLNLLVTDALRHVPDVIAFLSRLHNQSIFNFCAIPQVMALATLLGVATHNPMVFRGVEDPQGQAVHADDGRPTSMEASAPLRQALPSKGTLLHLSPIYLSAAMLLAALSWQYLGAAVAQAQGGGDVQGR
ncbi:hypothetical protein CRUP_007015 [Coryphaenoides rupestris]|nr:hypothetical protein CRUP_007015 [Coryphaenoides rupestris]